MELLAYLRVLRRRWWLLLAGPLIGVLVSSGYTLSAKPLYGSEAQIFVSTRSAANVSDLSQGGSYLQQLVKSYATVATSPLVLDPVRRQLNLTETVGDLQKRVSADAPVNTVVLNITADDETAVGSAAVANAVAAELAKAVSDLNPNTSDSSADVKLTVIQRAVPASAPVRPAPVIDAVIGILGGGLLSIVAIVVVELLDTRVRSEDDVDVLSAPLLGATAYVSRAAALPSVGTVAGSDDDSEAYRSLVTSLQFLNIDRAARIVVVTSSVSAEGKSTVAANAAIFLSESVGRVLLIDCDLRRPKLADYLGIDGSIGLTDVLLGRTDMSVAAQEWGDNGLHILPAGPVPPNPHQLVQSDSMRKLLDSAREQFDIVIVDAPPLLAVSDAAVLSKRSDGAIFVCSVRKARRPQVAQAAALLETLDAAVLGVVLTMVPRRGPDSYSYSYSTANHL